MMTTATKTKPRKPAKPAQKMTSGIDERILRPGWAGHLAPDELAFIKRRLKTDGVRRAAWGMKRGTGCWVGDTKIKTVAMDGIDALQNALSDGLSGNLYDGVMVETDPACVIHPRGAESG